MFTTTTIRTHRNLIRFLTPPVLFVVLLATVTNTYARSVFDAQLNLSLKVATPPGTTTPVIENKFGFATSFPRPRDKKGRPVGPPNPTKEWNQKTLSGGTATQDPTPLVAERKKVKHGLGLNFHVGGATDAFVAGDYGEGEGWASGRTRIRLGNFTGRDGLPPAQVVNVNLELDTAAIAMAHAVNGDASFDWAFAKYFYELTNEATGAVLAQNIGWPAGKEAESTEGDPAHGVGEGPKHIVPLRLPANSFTNIDLFGHVYAAGFSEVLPGPLPAVLPAWAVPFQQRAKQMLPDSEMNLEYADPLFGNVVGHGSWLVDDVAGVKGDDLLAVNGNDTVFLAQVATAPNQLQDLEISVETPVDEYTVFTLDNNVTAAGGVHLFGSQLELGTGVGDQFESHDQAGQLRFLLEDSSHDSQIERTGAFEFVGVNDPVSPNALQFQGELSPGQGAQFQTQILVHDSIDGVTDGMARLTLRHLTEGIAGDYTGDYVVDQQDYELWKETFGLSELMADGNGNGTIDAGDFTVWQDNFQQGNFPFTDFNREFHFGASNLAIPEPATALISLIGLGAVACLAGRRRA